MLDLYLDKAPPAPSTIEDDGQAADYLFHLYELFKDYVLTPPSVTTIIDKKTQKSRYNLSFSTLALPCFNEFYSLFYFEGKKIIHPLAEKIFLTI